MAMHVWTSEAFLAALLPEQGAALVVTTLLFMVGLAGTILPIMPGGLLVWVGIIIYKLWMGDGAAPPWWFVFTSGGLVLMSYLFDIVSGAWGVKKFGGTWRGAVGALIGGFVGFFIPPPIVWLIIGPVIGAIIGELIGGSKIHQAGKAGVGTVAGAIVGAIAKFSVCVFVIGWFYYLLLF